MRQTESKILSRAAMTAERARLRAAGKKLVFTNGAFDLLHAGHVTYLEFARAQGDALVVGLNSDASVRRYKGDQRPVNGQDDRARVLAALECVDYVVIFDQDEPAELLAALVPDVLVKGEDWAHYVSGRDIVEKAGGRVVLAPLVEGRSTSGIIERVLKAHGSDVSDKSDSSDKSDRLVPRLIPAHGGYRRLRTFQAAQGVYDGTVLFCDRFVPKKSRTHDQMVQAARSGAQNIAEGSMASGTSKKTEIKLTGVAKASLEELLLDFEDFLRQRGLRRWDKDSPEALVVRREFRSGSPDKSDVSDQSDPYGLASSSSEVAANTLICMIHQATYLLRRQLEQLDRAFLEQGGFTERLYRERTAWRAGQSDQSGSLGGTAKSKPRETHNP